MTEATLPTVERKHATIAVDFDGRCVTTTFRDGLSCGGTREDNDNNRREAADQGYTGQEAVWRSLVDHEVLHTLVSEWLYDSASPALRTAAGQSKPAPYYQRLEEESVVLAFQRWMNTGDCPHALSHYKGRLNRWLTGFQRTMAALGDPRYSDAA